MKIETYFNGEQYYGEAAYINGYNGYTTSQDHGLLCALVPDSVGVPSCWGNDGKPNTLTDKNGLPIRIPSRYGTHTVVFGFIHIGYETIQMNNHEDFIRLIDHT